MPTTDRPYLCYLGDSFAIEERPGTADPASSFEFVDWLEPVFVNHTGNAVMGEARILCHQPPQLVMNGVDIEQPIQIRSTLAVDGGSPSSPKVVWNGVVGKIDRQYRGTSTDVHLIAYNNADYFLYRTVLHGRQCLNNTKTKEYYSAGPADMTTALDRIDDTIRIDDQLVFNPDGLPNATNVIYQLDGDSTHKVRLFEAPGLQQQTLDFQDLIAVPWTLKDAIAYLMFFHRADWAINKTDYSESALSIFTSSTSGNPVISNVNLEGKSLLEALEVLLFPHNYGFFTSMESSGSGNVHRLTFYERGSSRSRSLHLSPVGTNAKDSVANLIHCHLTTDATPVVNALQGYGAQKVFCTAASTDPNDGGLLLVEGWAEADLDFGGPDPVDNGVAYYNEDFQRRYYNDSGGYIDPDTGVFGVGRLWIVNIQGENPEYEPADLTKILEDTDDEPGDIDNACATDKRRFERPIFFNRNSSGGQLQQEQVTVEMSFDGGDNFWIVPNSYYRILTDRMGIIFTHRNLEELGNQAYNAGNPDGINYWDAYHDNELVIKVVCSIKSDERVTAFHLNDGSQKMLATQRVFQNDGFKKVIYQVTPLNSTQYVQQFQPAEINDVSLQVDDTQALDDLVTQQLDNTNRLMTSGTAEVLMVGIGEYLPGDSITGIDNYETFQRYPTVQMVVYSFADQHVQITLDHKDVRAVLHAKRLYANRDQRTMGGAAAPMPAGYQQQVPYPPGDEKAMRQFINSGGELE